MKNNARKLLKRAARNNGIEIDSITGSRKKVDLYGSREFDDVLISASVRGRKIKEFSFYSDSGLYASVKVSRPGRFIDALGDISDYRVFSAQSFADELDKLDGVSKGQFSTYVSVGYDYAFS
tara:strand:+ start:1271 stop:1636 length:366 start_codon:yes stop_codon:yes gene_type:complete